VPSITHLKEKETGQLHQGIRDIIERCKVRKVIWLTDGDCFDIPTQLVDQDGKPKDLSTRPWSFFNSVSTFQQLLDQYKDVNKFFKHIKSDEIEGNPKGLDDLLVAHPDLAGDIVADLCNVSGRDRFAATFNITFGMSKVRKAFKLDSVDEFYQHHVERRPDLKDKKFKFRGTMYEWNEGENKCDVVVPGEASNYFRVGDNYYKFVQIPNQHKQLERVFHERRKGTITDDHGKEFLKWVPKYEAFCNVPDHMNFSPSLNNCFNVYAPLEFHPDDDECDQSSCQTIIDFIKHIFGETLVKGEINGEPFEVSSFEMGLDYCQLLYRNPQEKLPVLCLVSKENNTGKSTFANLLRTMLGSNVAIVGNADLAADFNSHWATKLVVACDETKIDKQTVVERVKFLSTAQKIMMNAKGRNQVEIDCFIKFILITNNEDSFIYASDEDIRYWVIKVPKLKKDNPNIMESFIDEMPAFLSFLNQRKMATTKNGRMWFHQSLLKTDALKKVVAFSQPLAVKELRTRIREMFFDFGDNEIWMALKDIKEEFFKGARMDDSFLLKILREFLKVDQYHIVPNQNDIDPETGQPRKKYVTQRFSYPKWEVANFDGKFQTVRKDIPGNGRPYIFKKEAFLTPQEISMYSVDEGTKAPTTGMVVPMGVTADPQTDLPF
jgi:hypothetical protein